MLSAAERRLDRNLPLLNYYSMLRGCLFILPVLAPFVHDRLRLDFFHLMLSEAIFAAAVVICEVPPGWLADVWRRVDVLRVSACLSLAAVILIWVADGFWVFALGQVVMGISISLQSGADSALLYDSLQARARATRFLPLEARRGGLALVVTALAALVGGLLYQLNPLLLWAADSIAAAAAIAIACFLTEPPRQRLSGHPRAFPKVFRAVAESFQTAPLLYGLIVAIAAVFAVTKIVLFLTQAFYMAYALPLAWFGPLAAGFFAVSALGGFLASWVRERLSLANFLTLLLLLLVLMMIGVVVIDRLQALPLLFLAGLIFGIVRPVGVTEINHRVSSEYRATVLSIAGLIYQISFIVVAPMAGFAASQWGPTWALGGTVLICLPFGLGAAWQVYQANRREAMKADCHRVGLPTMLAPPSTNDRYHLNQGEK